VGSVASEAALETPTTSPNKSVAQPKPVSQRALLANVVGARLRICLPSTQPSDLKLPERSRCRIHSQRPVGWVMPDREASSGRIPATAAGPEAGSHIGHHPCSEACAAHVTRVAKPDPPSYAVSDGRYWARTSDPQLVELVLSQLS
jgi:hypothetical protein